MEETVYQCPECNFNADNLEDLDEHMDGHQLMNHNSHKPSQQNSIINQQENDIIEDNDEILDHDISINQLIKEKSNNPILMNKPQTNGGGGGSYRRYERQYTCKHCEFYTSNPRAILYHRKHLHGERITVYECQFCEYATQYAGKVDRHIEYRHKNATAITPSNSIPNPVIPKENNIVEQFYEEEEDTDDDEEHQDNQVNVMNNSQKMNEEQNQDTCNGVNKHYERQYMCKQCSFVTFNPRAILYHRRDTHGERVNIHECNYCQYASQYGGKVERHSVLRHKQIKDQVPNATVDNNNSIINNSQHQQTFNENSNSNSEFLDNSNNITLDQSQLRLPITIDEQMQLLRCSKCPREYTRSSDLTKHLRTKHGIIRSVAKSRQQYAQQYQQSANSNNSSLIMNEQLRRNNLNNAKLSLDGPGISGVPDHTPEGSNGFQCPYCSFHSMSTVDYLSHVKYHINGRQFRCVLCNSVYKYRSDCVVHIRRKHVKFQQMAHQYVERFDLDEVSNQDINMIYAILKPKLQQPQRQPQQTTPTPNNQDIVSFDVMQSGNVMYGCGHCDYKTVFKSNVTKHHKRKHLEKQLHIIYLPQGGGTNGEIVEQDTFYPNDEEEEFEDQNGDEDEFIEDEEFNNDYSQEDEEFPTQDEEMIDYEDEEFINTEQDEFLEDEDFEENNPELIEPELIQEEEPRPVAVEQPRPVSQLTANGERVFPCSLCSYMAKNHTKLKLHMAMHCNLKRYVCPVCKRRGNFKWDIRKHMRKMHPDADQNQEVVCLSEQEAERTIGDYISNYVGGNNSNSPFKTTQHFNPTQQQHVPSVPPQSNGGLIRERKYKCSLCSLVSKYQWNIRKHIQTLHRGRSDGHIVSVNVTTHSNHHFGNSPNKVQPRPIAPAIPISENKISVTSPTKSANGLGLNGSVVSDTTGNKKFKCKLCPYRSNWKSDVFRHIKNIHHIKETFNHNVIVLQTDYAASSLADYERVHGINVRRKRFRTDAYNTEDEMVTNNSVLVNQNNEEHFEDLEHSEFNENEDEFFDDEEPGGGDYDNNEELNQENNNNQSNLMAGSQTVINTSNIHELKVRPYKCMKCGFRADRKADTIRHIRVRHASLTNEFLSVLSIEEASRTISHYEQTRVVKKRHHFIQPPTMNHHHNSHQNHHSILSSVLASTSPAKVVPAYSGSTQDYYKCPFCTSFQLENRLAMQIHLRTLHLDQLMKPLSQPSQLPQPQQSQPHQQQINQLFYKCSNCSFKTKLRQLFRRHRINCRSIINSNNKTEEVNRKSEEINSNEKVMMNGHHNSPDVIEIDDDEEIKEITNNNNKEENGYNSYDEEEEDFYEAETNENFEFNNPIEKLKSNNINRIVADHNSVGSSASSASSTTSNGSSSNANTNNNSSNNGLTYVTESIVLTDHEGKQFTTTYNVTHPTPHYNNQFGKPPSMNVTVTNSSTDNALANTKKMYYCQTCPYRTINYSNMKQHLLQHIYQPGFYKCRYCSYYLKLARLLKQHEVLHHEYRQRMQPAMACEVPPSTSNSSTSSNIVTPILSSC